MRFPVCPVTRLHEQWRGISVMVPSSPCERLGQRSRLFGLPLQKERTQFERSHANSVWQIMMTLPPQFGSQVCKLHLRPRPLWVEQVFADCRAKQHDAFRGTWRRSLCRNPEFSIARFPHARSVVGTFMTNRMLHRIQHHDPVDWHAEFPILVTCHQIEEDQRCQSSA